MKIKLKSVSMILCLMFILIVCTSCVESPDYYNMSEIDKIPSITKVVGERKVSSMTVNMQYTKYNYVEMKDPVSDVKLYVDYLRSVGFIAKTSLKYPAEGATLNLEKKSAEADKYTLHVEIKYDDVGYYVVAERITSLE